MNRLLQLWRALAFDHAEAHFDGNLKDAIEDALNGIFSLMALAALVTLAVAAVRP